MHRILIFMLVVSLIPFGAVQHFCHKKNRMMASWKKVLCILLFLLSWLPYMSAGLLFNNTASILLTWAQFLFVWLLFYGSLFLRLGKYSVVPPIVLGLMLMEPASSFITVSNDHIAFDLGNSTTIDLSRGGDKLQDFLYALYRISFAVLPLVGVHYLARSIEKDGAKQTDHK